MVAHVVHWHTAVRETQGRRAVVVDREVKIIHIAGIAFLTIVYLLLLAISPRTSAPSAVVATSEPRPFIRRTAELIATHGAILYVVSQYSTASKGHWIYCDILPQRFASCWRLQTI